jgi:hypothetical protein
MTSLVYKEDWQAAKERYIMWWNHEYFGRCALAVTAPRNGTPDVAPPPDAQTPQQRWYDLDWISRREEYRLSRTYFGGEAVPSWNTNDSTVSSVPALLGCPMEIDMATGWAQPVLTESGKIDFHRLNLDENHDAYRFTMKMLKRAVAQSLGKSIPSLSVLSGCGDILVALRGTEQLCFDCLERPDEVIAAEEYLMDIWCDFYDRCYTVIRDAADGSTCWMGLWSPGKHYVAQNDFSYNISPEMFREIFLPVIRKQTEFLDHTIYHVDGIGAFQHVDALCELPKLQALQILPGAGKPSPLHYIDVLKKVQAMGKNLHISIPADEVEQALSLLSARGLFISTWTGSENKARELLNQVERWSVDR